VKGTDRSIPIATVVGRVCDQSTHPLDTVAERPIFPAFPSGAHVAEVEIDPETGAVQVVGHAAVDDIGTMLSPVLAAGQVRAASCTAPARCSANATSTNRIAGNC
jgi:aerobic carbon-monoxide dehydrogenase large subunit